MSCKFHERCYLSADREIQELAHQKEEITFEYYMT